VNANELPTDPLYQLLQPERRTAIVDLGANPIEGAPPYRTLVDRGLATVIGFDPQPAVLDELLQSGRSLETYLPYAVGDGTTQTLHICAASGMTSFLKPDPRTLRLFPLFPEFGKVERTQEFPTRTLDSIDEIGRIDFMHIDVQGSELPVFQHGRRKLASAVAIQTEVSFVPLYENQPPFGEVDAELRSQGFIPHAFANINRQIIAPMMVNNNPRQGLNQLLEADAVYVRDFRDKSNLSDEQLRHLALLMHHCYRSFDLALYCLLALEERGCVPGGVNARYLEILRTTGGAK
jgi:FkbM family methyltransferase